MEAEQRHIGGRNSQQKALDIHDPGMQGSPRQLDVDTSIPFQVSISFCHSICLHLHSDHELDS
jgi:hypothetical protein